jgi:Subtilase family
MVPPLQNPVLREFQSPANLRFQTFLGCILLAGVTPLSADWRDEAGFTRLQLLAAGDLPAAPSTGFTQVEASMTVSPVYTFMPDTSNPLYSGKTFTNKSAATGTAISSHANHVATNFYGNTTSLISGNCPVDVYFASDWLNSMFLKFGSSSSPAVESHAVQNHSWAADGTGITNSQAAEIDKRLDFAIDRDGFVCAVGSDNNASTVLPQVLCQSYHTISVGRDDGGHSAGFTTLDGTGRIKPDIVAPSANPEYATSWTTPMVSGAAALLHAKLIATPYSLTGADKPRVIKALLLATATKIPTWANTSTRPLDLRYGAGILNINHAYNALRAGRATASNSTLLESRGWGAETVNGTSSKTYFFNIAAGAPSTPFSAALTWHRVITKGIGNSWTPTLANLNLHLHHASGFTVGTLVAESVGNVDNVELVYQSALTPGTYALVVENTSTTATPYAVAWHSLPAVTLAATVATAREINLQAGLITINRTGDTTLPLWVPLTASGSAVAVSHYLTLPAGVTIPAGQAATTLQVIPVADSLAQGNRSVSVAVAADFGLVSDGAQPAVVTLQDKPFDAWRFANFTGPELGNPSISAENADPDGDALPNLVEYALVLNPKDPGISTITTSRSSGYLTLTTPRNTALTEDILWSAEASSDLATWQAAAITTNTTNVFAASDPIPAANAPKRFIRLKITRP